MNAHTLSLHSPEITATPIKTEVSDDSYYVAFKFGDPKFANLLRQYFRLRKKVFIDSLGWELNEYDGMEIDQYDQETAEYILQIKDGRCIGGCRLMPTTTKFTVEGQEYSYMLRDARLGRLDGFPTEVTDHIPVSKDVWELTRVVSAKNTTAFRDMMEQVRKRLKTYNVKNCLFITRAAMYKICRFWGYDIRIIGPELSFGTMKAVTLDCNVAYYKDKLEPVAANAAA